MHKRQTMRARALVLAVVSASLGLAAQGAFAQAQAYTNQPVDLFAGPSGDYPVVAQLGPSQPVTVMGCVSDYSWCDVALPDMRGWVYADYLNYPYDGSYVPIEGYGAAIGLPIVTFTLGAYWDSFYRDRPWYNDRARWAHVPPPGRGERPPGMRGEPGPQGGHFAPPPGARGFAPEGNRPRPPEYGGAPRENARPPMNEAPREGAPAMERPAERPAAPQYGRPAAPPAGAYAHPPMGGPRPEVARPEAPRPEAPHPGAGGRPGGAPQGHPPAERGGHENRPQN